MKNTYSFSFLFSPPNPRYDGWIGQSFALSYLNSEPGNSYLFRYKPYFIGDSRIDRDWKLANLKSKAGGESDHHALSVRANNRQGYVSDDMVFAIIRRRLDVLLMRDFAYALKKRSARVLQLISADPTPLSFDELRLRLLEQAQKATDIHHASQWGDRIHPSDGFVLDEMLLGYIDKIRRGLISMRQLTTEKHFEIIRSSLITYPYEFAEHYLIGFVSEGILGSRKPVPDPIGIKLHMPELAFRPYEQDSILLRETIGEKVIPTGIVYPHALIAHEPEKIGTIEQAIIGHRSNQQDAVLSIVQLGAPEDKYGVMPPRMRTGETPVDEGIRLEGRYFDPFVFKEASTLSLANADVQKSGDARIDWLIITPYGSGVHEGHIEAGKERTGDYGDADAYVHWERFFFDGPNTHAKPSYIVDRVVRGESHSYNAAITQDLVMLDGKDGVKHARIDDDRLRVEPFSVASRIEWSEIVRANLIAKGASTEWNPTEIIRADLLALNAKANDPTFIVRGEPLSHNARMDFIDSRTILMPHGAWEFNDLTVRVDKIQLAAWVIDAIKRVDDESKAMIIVEHRHLLDLLPSNTIKIIRDIWAHYEDIGNDAIITDGELFRKAEKESLVRSVMAQQLLASRIDLDAIILELIQFDKISPETLVYEYQMGDRHAHATASQIDHPNILSDRDGVQNEAIKQQQQVAEREELYGIIKKLIVASNEMKHDRPAYIPKKPYLLVGDMSEWEDIWRRYSPGVDVLDVPNSDFDYSKLANQVYDPETGVPFHPIGPTNKPEVRVKIPLHHPVPNFSEVGIGEAVVDNYILMDVILAVESIKNRNKLRFAGMPAERTIRELLSKLYAWIEQAAPGVFEYERVFRFVRWYAEAVVTQISEHILVREYKPWISQIHNGGDLGIPYTATNWRYLSNASVLQTSDTQAVLSFRQSNYIDGTMTIRGYFDNPRGEGKMEVRVDGEVQASLGANNNGVFTLTFDVPQGHHNYDIVFEGDSGRISLSSLEITGCVFVGATTIADDSNTNGLKACTTLMQMLLYYYDKHHGDNKVKGTMAIKQRKVWQQT